MRHARWLLAAWFVGCATPRIAPKEEPEPEEPIVEPEPTPTTPIVDAGTTVDAAEAGPPGLQVFVTSTTTLGNTMGLGGADAICGLLGARFGARWAAWLSVEDGPHAAERVTSAGPWTLPSGEVVAQDKASLLSGRLLHAIDRDENGALRSGEKVWTGSSTSGRYDDRDCDRWTTGTNGRVGNSGALDSKWTSDGDQSCKTQRRLYCFEL